MKVFCRNRQTLYSPQLSYRGYQVSSVSKPSQPELMGSCPSYFQGSVFAPTYSYPLPLTKSIIVPMTPPRIVHFLTAIPAMKTSALIATLLSPVHLETLILNTFLHGILIMPCLVLAKPLFLQFPWKVTSPYTYPLICLPCDLKTLFFSSAYPLVLHCADLPSYLSLPLALRAKLVLCSAPGFSLRHLIYYTKLKSASKLAYRTLDPVHREVIG